MLVIWSKGIQTFEVRGIATRGSEKHFQSMTGRRIQVNPGRTTANVD